MKVDEGEIVGLVGPNGAGKTTLFNVISHFLPYDQGEIRFNGRSLGGLSIQDIVRLGILRTFQTPIGFPGLSCIENLMAVPLQKGERIFPPIFRPRRVTEQEQGIYAKAAGLLSAVNLYDKRHEPAANLSAGELKLLELSRQLMMDPKLLLLDEPASGVNPAMLDRMVEHIRRIRDKGTTFLVIDHNLGFIMQICDRIYVMAQGKIIASGTPKEIAANPLVKAVYLGGSSYEAS